MTDEAETPVFKKWTFTKLADISDIDVWQRDKCLYYIRWAINMAVLKKKRIQEITYYEQGRISIVLEDMETGEITHEPPLGEPPIEVDPLS